MLSIDNIMLSILFKAFGLLHYTQDKDTAGLGTGSIIIAAVFILGLLGLGFFVKKKYF